jgi:S1-C subfamily serine protease
MEPKRYSFLAPLALELRRTLVVKALYFFSPLNYREVCGVVGKTLEAGSIRPMAARDFLKYLNITGVLSGDADRFQQQIRGLLDRLVTTEVLIKLGPTSDPLLGAAYYFMKEMTNRQALGALWLAPALGPDHLYAEYSKVTVHLTGINEKGDVTAGTGLLVAPTFILTCAHVVNDMDINETQKVQGQSCRIVRSLPHSKIDVAVIQVDRPFQILPDLHFREPIVSEVVYILGFPKMRCTQVASLLMQRGEVTSPVVRALDWTDVFLFSAAARPGNSGGPIVSEDGAVLGIVTRDLLAVETDPPVLPFYAGVPTSCILTAISHIAPELSLPTDF